MTDSPPVCPKCGADERPYYDAYSQFRWLCGSREGVQSERCRIRELEQEIRLIVASLDELWALPHEDCRVRRDIRAICKHAEATLAIDMLTKYEAAGRSE